PTETYTLSLHDALPISEPETLTRQVFAPRNADEQNTLRIETAINGVVHSSEFFKNDGQAVLTTAHRGNTETFDPPITILPGDLRDRKSTRLNSSHLGIS